MSDTVSHTTETTPEEAGHEEAGHEEAGHEDGAAHGHPTEWQYIKIAIVLCLITGAEVAVYYVEMLKGALPFILITMSIVKFTLVVMWFMHLRFDAKMFRRFFVTGLILAGFCYGVVLSTFHVWTR